jgi:Tol biopolymer transport system component
MEYVEGETLRQRLQRRRLDVRESLDIATQIASALSVAHAGGIVHRDIKPENVIIRPDGFVKVLDFGLAKLLPAREHVEVQSTQTAFRTDAGTVVGTIAYMSPEQARGEAVDARTDIWSLGCVLYEMVAGRPPFAARSSSDTLAAILEHDPDLLARFDPDVPSELQRIVGKALRKDPDERYQVMKDLLLDLKALRETLSGLSKSGRSQSAGTGSTRSRARPAIVAAVAAVCALVAAGAWWWTRVREPAASPREAAAVNRPLTRVTFAEGLQTDPTFSPDGRLLAYASGQSGNFDIWVQNIGGGNAVQVTHSPAHDTQPAWSPDGKTIAFRSERDGGGLYTVPALGGIERRIASFGGHPTWTTDSREVLFLAGVAPGEGHWQLQLHRVALDGSPPREVLGDFLAGGLWYWVAPHPDGRISAWGWHRTLGDGFYTVSADGKHVVSRFRGEASFAIERRFNARRRFQWHPDGTALFVQTEVSNIYNLWKVRVDPRDLAWVSAERLTTGAGADLLGTLSPDATRLAFSAQTESSRLWRFALEPSAQRLGAGQPVTEEGTDASYGTFSRDGRSVAYVLSRPGSSRFETWIRPTEGGRGQLITTDSDGPIWSPDGQALAYSYARPPNGATNDVRVVIRQLAGAERPVSALLTGGFFFPKYWTRRGDLLGLYQTDRWSKLVLWTTTRTDASEPARVVASQPDANFWQPMYSPNERWLSFILQRNGSPHGTEMYVSPADGGPSDGWTRIASDHAWPDKPRWAPDGRTLYFISRRPAGYFNVWAVRVDPERGIPVGQPFALSSFDSPGLYISPYLERAEMDVSARHILLTMRSASGSIWMLENVDK